MSQFHAGVTAVPQITIEPSQQKRTTCDCCRDRKVKCDRTKPECLRCQRSGHKCTYPSAEGEATKLNSTLQTLHSRLVQAEMMLQQHSLVPADYLFDRTAPALHREVVNLQQDHGLLPGNNMDIENGILPGFAPWDDAMCFDVGDPGPMDPRIDARNPQQNFATLVEPLQPRIDSVADHLHPSLWVSDPSVESSGTPQTWDILHDESNTDLDRKGSRGVCGGKEAASRAPEFFDTYFNNVQRHLPLINRHKFMTRTMDKSDHPSHALKASVAMSGAAVVEDDEAAQLWYSRARSHIEKSEMGLDGSSCMKLEVAQAMLLVARFEFVHGHGAMSRALLTMARLYQLLLLLGYDRLDGTTTGESRSVEHESGSTSAPSGEPGVLHECRCVFWAAFAMQCTSLMDPSCVMLNSPQEICTKVPVTSSGKRNLSFMAFPIDEAITEPAVNGLDIFSLFIIANYYLLQANRHEAATLANISGAGSPNYNFCAVHEKLDTSIHALLASITASHVPAGGHGTEVRILAQLIILGARIKLYKAAIANVHKARFLAPVVGECERLGVMTASAMSDILVGADVLSEDRNPMYKSMSFFIMPPLAIAATIQLQVLKEGVKDSGHNGFYIKREIQQSLEIVCDAMALFKGSSDQHDSLIQEVQTLLDGAHIGKRPHAERDSRANIQRRRTQSHAHSV